MGSLLSLIVSPSLSLQLSPLAWSLGIENYISAKLLCDNGHCQFQLKLSCSQTDLDVPGCSSHMVLWLLYALTNGNGIRAFLFMIKCSHFLMYACSFKPQAYPRLRSLHVLIGLFASSSKSLPCFIFAPCSLGPPDAKSLQLLYPISKMLPPHTFLNHFSVAW